MPTSFWITMSIAGLILWLLSKLAKTLPPKTVEEPEPEPFDIQFYGGPLDGMIQPVERDSDFYVAPYIPKTEDGEIDTSQAKIMGQMGDRVYFEPVLAYYQQIQEDSYFYVRDISQDELIKLNSNPTWRPMSDDKTDTE